MRQNEQAKPQEKRTKVLLVDDHAVMRYGIALLINRQKDLLVCGEAEDAATAMDAIVKLKPGLALVDISLKDSTGLELIKNVKAQFPKLPVLVMSMHDESLYAELALRAGASGYINKNEPVEIVLTAIRKVLSGEIHVSSVFAAKMLEQQVRGQTSATVSPHETLSDREREVFQLIGQWKGTSQIAKELHLSVKTVEYYREQIKHKLNLSNASELVQYATAWFKRKTQD